MFSASRSNLAAILLAVLGSLAFLIGLLIKGPQLEPTSFVDSNIQVEESHPVELSADSSNRFSFEIEIVTQKLPQAFELLVGTFDDPSVLIRSAHATSANGACRYETKKDTLLQNNNHLRFNIAECNLIPNQLTITVETAHPVKLALWTYSISSSKAALLGVRLRNFSAIPATNIRYIYGFFQFHTHKPEMKKYELLHFMWDLGIDSQYFLVGLVFVFFLANFFIGRSLMGNCTPLLAAIAWLFLSISYSLLVPPFQAPDEPDHALTYAGLSSDESLGEEMLKLAQRGHFEHLKFYAHHKFTSTLLLFPGQEGWASHVAVVDMKYRSPLTYMVWSVYSKLLYGKSASAVLLALRILNSTITACGVFLTLMFLRSDRRLRSILVFLLFAMPALPFFAMHVSNYFTSIFLAFLHCGVFASLLRGDKFMGLKYFACGCMISFSLVSSAISTGFLASWVLLMPWVFHASLKKGVVSWLAHLKAAVFLIFGLVTGHLVFSAEFHALSLSWTTDYKYWLMALKSENRASIAGAVMILWVLAVACLSFFLQLALTGKLATLKKSLDKIGRLISRGILIFLCVLNLLTLFYKFLPLPNIEDPQFYLAPFSYALSSLKAGLLALTFVHMDTLFSSSFWMGFGWLEAYPPDSLMLMIRSPLILGYLFYFWKLSVQPAEKGPSFDWRGLFFAISLFVMLLGLSFATSAAFVNLHGRYLIGYYMLMAVPSAIGWGYFLDTKIWQRFGQGAKDSPRLASTFFVVSCHVYSAWFLLDRYF